MLTHNEIKAIMAQKFKDEHCCFTEKDIKVRFMNNTIDIQIRDYDHISFKLVLEKVTDVDFMLPFAVTTYEYYLVSPMDKEIVGYHDSKNDFPVKEALIYLAYHIARTF